MKNIIRIILLAILALPSVALAQQLYVGAAKRVTTPNTEWLPLSGVARSNLIAEQPKNQHPPADISVSWSRN